MLKMTSLNLSSPNLTSLKQLDTSKTSGRNHYYTIMDINNYMFIIIINIHMFMYNQSLLHYMHVMVIIIIPHFGNTVASETIYSFSWPDIVWIAT